MVLFSCCAFAANRAASIILPGRTDIISAAGAFVIGLLGNLYSRVVGGTAFTSMVTGVLFLVPVSPVIHMCFPVATPFNISLVSLKVEASPKPITVQQNSTLADSLSHSE